MPKSSINIQLRQYNVLNVNVLNVNASVNVMSAIFYMEVKKALYEADVFCEMRDATCYMYIYTLL